MVESVMFSQINYPVGLKYITSDSTSVATILAGRTSIFTAELYAIVLAYMLLYRKPHKQFIVFSDSLSALQAVSSLKDLFYHVSTRVIVDFIKDIGFYDQL